MGFSSHVGGSIGFYCWMWFPSHVGGSIVLMLEHLFTSDHHDVLSNIALSSCLPK